MTETRDTQTARPDPVCEHGVAMDVHCCGCHSGFLFDVQSCRCLDAAEGEDMGDKEIGQHTAGPWIWSFFCKPSGEPIESVKDVADTIAGSAHYSERAELFGVTLNDADQHEDGRATVVCYTGNGPNAHNNARLIAAAPEMLAALKDAAEGMHNLGYIETWERLVAVIAKAEGQLPGQGEAPHA